VSVSQSGPQSSAAAELAQQRQTIGTRLATVVDVRRGFHQRAHYHLGVVLKEVDLMIIAQHSNDSQTSSLIEKGGEKKKMHV